MSELVGHNAAHDNAVVRLPDGSKVERAPVKKELYVDESPRLSNEEVIPAASWQGPESPS